MIRLTGWISGALRDVVFSGAKVTALLGVCARPELANELKDELVHNGEGYLMAALTLAEMERIDPVRCGVVLERVLRGEPSLVLTELSEHEATDVTVELIRTLTPLTSPVRESYLDILEKLKATEPQELVRSAKYQMTGTASWMMFEFPQFLLRSELLPILDGAFCTGWPMDPANPRYDSSDLMDDIRHIALTIEGNLQREQAFAKSLQSAQDAQALVQIVLGWREYANEYASAVKVADLFRIQNT